MTVSERAQLASIEIAEIIAMKSKSHTLTESVILPACKNMVKSLLSETAEKEISKIPLSNDTIHMRIFDLSENIGTNVHKKLEGSKFALILIHYSYFNDSVSKPSSSYRTVWNMLRFIINL